MNNFREAGATLYPSPSVTNLPVSLFSNLNYPADQLRLAGSWTMLSDYKKLQFRRYDILELDPFPVIFETQLYLLTVRVNPSNHPSDFPIFESSE